MNFRCVTDGCRSTASNIVRGLPLCERHYESYDPELEVRFAVPDDRITDAIQVTEQLVAVMRSLGGDAWTASILEGLALYVDVSEAHGNLPREERSDLGWHPDDYEITDDAAEIAKGAAEELSILPPFTVLNATIDEDAIEVSAQDAADAIRLLLAERSRNINTAAAYGILTIAAIVAATVGAVVFILYLLGL